MLEYFSYCLARSWLSAHESSAYLEANIFPRTILLPQQFKTTSPLWVGLCPENSSSFNRLTFKCFINFNKARICPKGELVSLLFPLSPPPQLYNTPWCHRGIYFPSWEVQACAHVTSGVRAYRKTTKGIKVNRTCVIPSQDMQWHPTGALWRPWWLWEVCLLTLANSLLPPALWHCNASATLSFYRRLCTFYPSSRQLWASQPHSTCWLPSLCAHSFTSITQVQSTSSLCSYKSLTRWMC